MNSGLTSHLQRGHTETGPRFKVSSEKNGVRFCKISSQKVVWCLEMDLNAIGRCKFGYVQQSVKLGQDQYGTLALQR